MKKNSQHRNYKFSDILIVGLKYNEQMDVDDLISSNFSILDHYNPLSNQIPSYLENINMMCFVPPVNLYSSLMVPLSNHKPNDNYKSQHTKDINQKDCIHQFVLTDSQGDKRYCTSLIIYEKIKVFKSSESFLPYDQQTEEVYVPYSFILVSNNKCLFSQQNIMLALYKGWLNNKQRNDCIISNMKKALNPSTQQLFEFFISVVFSLPQEIEFTKPVKIIISLEQKQHHEGKRKKEIEKLQLSQYFPGIKDPLFNFPETDFQYLFNRLSIYNILRILHSLLLEKQIIIFTENVWELTSICEALLCLIQPFQWRCLYIPYLPNNMIEIIHATVPFLIGVNTNVRKKMISEVQDKICVFLDEDRIVGLNVSSILIFIKAPQRTPKYLLNPYINIFLQIVKNMKSKYQERRKINFIKDKQFNYIGFSIQSENFLFK